MILYEDENRENILISSRGNFATDPQRRDDYRGGERRTLNGTLKTWSVYNKYNEQISITQIGQSNLEILEDIIYDRQTVYYCPDVIKRNSELYTVKISTPVEARYVESTGKYDMVIRVREV